MATADETSGADLPPLFTLAHTDGGPGTPPDGGHADPFAFFQFTEADRDRLRSIRKRLTPVLPEIIRDYYGHLTQFAAPAAAFGTVDRQHHEAHLQTYILEILAADFSDAHLERRRRIGLAHGEDGLAHVWFTGSYRFLERAMGQALRAGTDSLDAYLEDRRALGKVMSYDLGLVMNAHVAEFAAALDERNAELLREKELRARWTQMLVHDMAGPLTTIATATGVLDASADDPAVFGRCVEVLRRAERRLKDMLQDMLDVYAGEAMPLEIACEPFDLRELAEEVLAEFDLPDVPETPEYALDAPPVLPPVRADRPLLMRVLRNLVENATKYTPAEGRVAIQLRPSSEPRVINVRVEDSGEGIPVQFRGHVFDQFYTVEPGDEPGSRRGGTGLGLPFCKAVIEAHGQSIGIETPAAGAGTAFTFSLPIADRDSGDA